ncbi:MAG: TIGR04283 family arsenosugar biosynthesis glycosyltransferase [Spirochaetota bacterium]
MIPSLSIVIPVYHEPLEIGGCLAYLARCRGISECEIIVAEGDDGESFPQTDVLPIRTVRAAPGRGTQLNAGARTARGDALLFLHVDTRPPRAFVRIVAETLASYPAGAFDLHIESSRPLVRAVSLVGLARSRLTRIPYGDQAQFIRSDVFHRVGGFPNEPIMEDVALMDRLKARKLQIRIVRPPARTSGRRWEREGAVATTLRNWRTMLAYRSGIRPCRLAIRYRPHAELEQRALARTGPHGSRRRLGGGPNDGRSHLIVFHRALRAGEVKTRLAADVGTGAALALYRAMLLDLMAEASTGSARTLYYVDDPSRGLDVPGRSYPQNGRDLWARMDDALRRSFASGAERAVLIGSDVPGITRSLLRQARARLRHADVVLGPSRDGGFYLIGSTVNAYASDLARCGALDPGRSAELVLGRAHALGLTTAVLPTLPDIDTISDLRAVLAENSLRSPHLRAEARRILRTP